MRRQSGAAGFLRAPRSEPRSRLQDPPLLLPETLGTPQDPPPRSLEPSPSYLRLRPAAPEDPPFVPQDPPDALQDPAHRVLGPGRWYLRLRPAAPQDRPASRAFSGRQARRGRSEGTLGRRRGAGGGGAAALL